MAPARVLEEDIDLGQLCWNQVSSKREPGAACDNPDRSQDCWRDNQLGLKL